MASLNLEQVQNVILEGAPRADFPVIIMTVAVFKDILDAISLGLAGVITSLFMALIIYLWVFTKANFIQKRLMRYFIRRLWWLLFGFIPGLNFIPESIILVLLIHNKEKKIVKAFYERADRLSRGKPGITNIHEFAHNTI